MNGWIIVSIILFILLVGVVWGFSASIRVLLKRFRTTRLVLISPEKNEVSKFVEKYCSSLFTFHSENDYKRFLCFVDLLCSMQDEICSFTSFLLNSMKDLSLSKVYDPIKILDLLEKILLFSKRNFFNKMDNESKKKLFLMDEGFIKCLLEIQVEERECDQFINKLLCLIKMSDYYWFYHSDSRIQLRFFELPLDFLEKLAKCNDLTPRERFGYIVNLIINSNEKSVIFEMNGGTVITLCFESES